MGKSRYVRLKDLRGLMEKYPNAILAYPVDPNKYEYTSRLAGEFHDEVVEMSDEFVGPGSPRNRHLVIIQ